MIQNGLFITGTDTGVGKTRVAAALLRGWGARGHRVVGMTPVVSGALLRDGVASWEDVDIIAAASTAQAPLAQRNPYRFEAALSPHIAAQRAGQCIDLDVITAAYAALCEQADLGGVEGAGGGYAPISDTKTMADLARALNLPVVLVVGVRLGCINHALLTAEAIRRDGLPLAGWVANMISPEMLAVAENMATLQSRLAVPLLGVMPWQPGVEYDLPDFEWGVLFESAQ